MCSCFFVFHLCISLFLLAASPGLWIFTPGITEAFQQQHFLVKPKDTEAVEGSTVDIQCQVSALAGDVQWSKDGFLLGFDPAIPGYARYSMVLDVGRGIYNLRIHNVQMEDEAEYQCQVGPAPNNTPIRADAKVTVIVPPRALEIRGHKNVTTLETREGQKLTLVCVARNSKPATKLKWLKNGVVITKDVSPIKEDTSPSNLKTTSISLFLSPKLDDNGAIYSCAAEHPAVTRPLKTSMFLSVLYPPGAPQIEGYHDGDIVQVGDKLTLACISRGGNPPAKLVWYRGDEQVDITYTTSGRESTNTHTFTVGSTDNRMVYRCEATNVVTLQPLIATVRLNVLFAPTKVTITGPKEVKISESFTLSCKTGPSNPAVEVSWYVDGRPMMSTQGITEDDSGGWITTSNVTATVSRQDPDTRTFSCYATSEALGETLVQTTSIAIVYPPSPPTISGYEEGTAIKAGDLQRLVCVSKGGNPHATLRWFKADKEIRGTEKPTGSGSSKELVIRAEASDNNAIYKCNASNTATEDPLSVSIKLSVLFPPTSVTIKMKPRKAKAGDMVVLTCEAKSSNPESTIVWWKDGESLPGFHEGVFDAEYGGKSTRNRLRFNVSSSDDQSTYTCQATNHALRRTVHEKIQLRVLYKPEFLVSPAQSFEVLEGESTVVNASARGNPPQIVYSWTRNGLPLLDMADGSTRPGNRRYGHRAVFRGPLLELTDVTRDDGGEYSCEAANTEGVTWTTISVNVIYPAVITKTTKSTMVSTGESAVLECEAIANPFVNRMITWRRKGFDMSRTHETVEKGRSQLKVLNVSRQDAGDFECVATNGIGKESVQRARLIVKFKPEVRLPHSFMDVAGEEGEAARLVCLAEGAPEVSFVWSYNGGIIGDNFSSSKYASQAAQLDDVTWESVLFVKHLQSNDFGYYTCVARNDIGHDHVKVKLRRRGRPDPPYNIRIVNSSYDSVVLSWTPGYSSGLPQQFRIRYHSVGSDDTKYADVFPSNSTVFGLAGLDPAKEYIFSLAGRNMLGESDYSREDTRAFTLKWRGEGDPTGAALDAFNVKNGEIPKLLLVIVSVVGSLLLALNVVLVVCFIRRRKKRQKAARGSPKTETQTTSPDSLMYTPSKYQQTINGEAIGAGDSKDACQDEILMKEIFDTKRSLKEKCAPTYQTVSPYDFSQAREDDNCPDILKNRGNDHVSLNSLESNTLLSSSETAGGVTIEDIRHPRRYLLPEEAVLCHNIPLDSPAGSCVLGTVGSHLV